VTDDPDERFPLVDESGAVIGEASRAACHADPSLLHPTVHIVVETPSGRLWQLRGADKDVWPGAWDDACAGHLAVGETARQAARRELREELGLEVEEHDLVELGRVVVRTSRESELTTVFRLRHPGPFVLAPPEVAGLAVFARGTKPSPITPTSEMIAAALGELA
jgi:isopentenyldiphosphate isomerase